GGAAHGMKEALVKKMLGLAVLMVGTAATLGAETNDALREQVRARERAFAKTMADRDHAAFQTFLADEAVFFGPAGATRGKAAVAAEWRPLFEKPAAPFSWDPETVEVLDSGTLAISSGPVKRPDGTSASSFNSIWRRESDGVWRVVFDKGCP
ncbi:MAG: nuclear transport factor 2 family protein, partial [Vicinamibacteria bacterium]